MRVVYIVRGGAWPDIPPDLTFAYMITSNASGDLPHAIAALTHQRARKKKAPPSPGLLILVLRGHNWSYVERRLNYVFGDDDGVTVWVIVQSDHPAIQGFEAAELGTVMGEAKAHFKALRGVKLCSHVEMTRDAARVRDSQDRCPSWPRLVKYRELVEQSCSDVSPESVGDVFRQAAFFFGIQMYRKTVCVWTRMSGKRKVVDGVPTGRGGANPQYDTSVLGLANLCQMFAAEDYQVLLIGPGAAEVATKHRDMLASEDIRILGKYWETLGACGGGNFTREHENAYFAFLYFQWWCPIVHVGMKSGQMDELGFIWGQPTVFVHRDVDKPVINRVNALTVKERLIPVEADHLPTLTGRIIRLAKIKRTSLQAEDWALIDLCKAYLRTGTWPPGRALPEGLDELRQEALAGQHRDELADERGGPPEADLSVLRGLSRDTLEEIRANVERCMVAQMGTLGRAPFEL